MGKAVLESLRQNFRQAIYHRRMQEAEDILTRLKKEDPLSVETRGAELELYVEMGKSAGAADLAEQLCRTFPGSARIFFLSGKLAYRQKRYSAAEPLFRESLRIHPSPQTQYWLGKTLTQSGRFPEAESLLMEVRRQNPWALLALAWLHERRNDLESALRFYDEFLALHPDDAVASDRRLRLKARTLDPEALIEEVKTLSDFGEPVPRAVFPELIQSLFETGRTPQAREQISARAPSLEPGDAVQLAWICYRNRAFDLACMLFLGHLRQNMHNFKYLAALETAARKCNRLEDVVEAYGPLCPEARHLYGRRRLLRK